MNELETADVLSVVAAYDQRTVGRADVAAWHLAIGELDKQLALQAVVTHHKTNIDRIKPAHVLGIARTIRRERAERDNADPYQRSDFEDRRDRKLGITPATTGPRELPIPTAGQPVWPAYEINDAIDRICPHCGAQPNDACLDPSNQQPARIPCLARITGKPTWETM